MYVFISLRMFWIDFQWRGRNISDFILNIFISVSKMNEKQVWNNMRLSKWWQNCFMNSVSLAFVIISEIYSQFLNQTCFKVNPTLLSFQSSISNAFLSEHYKVRWDNRSVVPGQVAGRYLQCWCRVPQLRWSVWSLSPCVDSLQTHTDNNNSEWTRVDTCAAKHKTNSCCTQQDMHCFYHGLWVNARRLLRSLACLLGYRDHVNVLKSYCTLFSCVLLKTFVYVCVSCIKKEQFSLFLKTFLLHGERKIL